MRPEFVIKVKGVSNSLPVHVRHIDVRIDMRLLWIYVPELGRPRLAATASAVLSLRRHACTETAVPLGSHFAFLANASNLASAVLMAWLVQAAKGPDLEVFTAGSTAEVYLGKPQQRAKGPDSIAARAKRPWERARER